MGPSLMCMVLLISVGTIKADHTRSSKEEGRQTKPSDPEFRDMDYDDLYSDQDGDYEDEIYSYEEMRDYGGLRGITKEQQTTTHHPKILQTSAEADFYSQDPEFHDADYDDKFVVITERLLVNVDKYQDFALIITAGTFASLAVIVIGLMSFRYSECNKATKLHKPTSTATLPHTKLGSKDANDLKPIISGFKSTRGYNKLKQEPFIVESAEEDLMLKTSV